MSGTREDARAQGADGQEQGGEAMGKPQVQAPAGDGGLASAADLELPEEPRHGNLARSHLSDDQGGRERVAEDTLPTQEAEASDKGDERPREGQRPQASGRGRRRKVRRLEMDLIVGKGQKNAIPPLCERSRNYLMMEKLLFGKRPDKIAEAVTKVL